jgi:hypothetical protein
VQPAAAGGLPLDVHPGFADSEFAGGTFSPDGDTLSWTSRRPA